MLIDDLVVLGRSCPEPLKDGRVTVCLAGWSDKLGFVRLYPTRRDMPGKRWDVIKVEVKKNPRDTRMESWKIAGSKSDWEKLSENIEVVRSIRRTEERRNLVGNLADSSVAFINEEKRSLGIVKPIIQERYFKDNPRYGELYQAALPGMFPELDATKTKRDYPLQPRVKYTCSTNSSATKRDHQILEWGFYEWLRKNPDNPDQVWVNAGFEKDDTDIFFLVGNLARHRTTFMVISVLRFPSGDIVRSMFPLRKVPPANLLPKDE